MKTSDIVPISLTRRELYDLVWSAPMAEAAMRLGISRTWLDKICQRADVPHPDRRYWDRLSAGEKPPRPPLERSKAAEPIVLKPRIPARLAERMDRRGEAAAQRPGRLHSILSAWREEIHWHREEQLRRQPWIKPESPPPELERRRFCILDQLIRELECRGHDVRRTTAQFGRLGLDIDARLVEVALSGASAVNVAMGDELSAADRDKPWLAPLTGPRLLLEVIPALDRTAAMLWRDDPETPLESRIAYIVDDIQQLVRQLQTYKVRELVARAGSMDVDDPERCRWHALRQLAAHCDAVDSVRRMLGRLEQTALEQQGAITADQAAWLEWANGRLANEELSLNLEELIAAIEQTSLSGQGARRAKS